MFEFELGFVQDPDRPVRGAVGHCKDGSEVEVVPR
jgi:hypothetical protein